MIAGGVDSSQPADVLLDRDGVLLVERDGYVLCPDEVQLLPRAGEAVRRLCEAGHRVFVVTNQSPVGRGLLTMGRLDEIHDRVRCLVRAHGGNISAFFVCPHVPTSGCPCRKPAPGLLFAARDQVGVDLSRAIVVGDQASDMQAAQRAGCHAVLVRNRFRDLPRRRSAGLTVYEDLLAAALQLSEVELGALAS